MSGLIMSQLRLPRHQESPLNQTHKRLVALLFGFVLLFSVVLRVGVAVWSPNLYWPDEVYQSRETAHFLAYGTAVKTWEFRTGARSWVFPAFLAVVMRATDWMGSGSDGYLLGITIVLALISLTTIWFAFAWAYRVSGTSAAVIAGLGSVFWYELIYFAPKSFNEVLAGHLLLPGLYLGVYGPENPLARRKRLFWAGVFLGLVVALRIQLAPAVLVAAGFFCWKNWRTNLLPVAAGIALPVVAFGMADAVTWSQPFHSYLAMFQFHIQNESTLDQQAWHYYLVRILTHYGPLVPFAFLGARRSPFLGWVILAIVIPHTLIPHKEWRYIYPAMPLIITLSGIGVTEVVAALNARLTRPKPRFAVIAVSVLFFVCTSAAIAIEFPGWRQHAGDIEAFQKLSHDKTLCGVALYKNAWTWPGGYTYLHRNVPIFLFSDETPIEKLAPSFNALVTSEPLPEHHDGFKVAQCWDSRHLRNVPMTVCLYQRPGGCTDGDAEYELNETLIRIDK